MSINNTPNRGGMDPVRSLGQQYETLVEAKKTADPTTSKKIDTLLKRANPIVVGERMFSSSSVAGRGRPINKGETPKVDVKTACETFERTLNKDCIETFFKAGGGAEGKLEEWAKEPGHEDLLLKELKKNPEELEKGGKKDQLLKLAVGLNMPKLAEALIKKGADVNHAFEASIKGGNTEMIEMLLDNGANISTTTMSGKSCFEAVLEEPSNNEERWGNVEKKMHLLIDNAKDINTQDSKGETPLHTLMRIVYKKDINNSYDRIIEPEKQIEKLLARGPNFDLQDSQGQTALHVAIQTGFSKDLISDMITEENINTADKQGQTPLHLAAKRGNVALVRSLIEQGAEINAKDSKGETPLYNAIKSGNVDLVKMLVEEGKIDLKAVDEENEGRYPLMFRAVDSDNAGEMVAYFAEKGLDVNQVVKQKRKGLWGRIKKLFVGDHKVTPLSYAVRKNKVSATEALLKKGANRKKVTGNKRIAGNVKVIGSKKKHPQNRAYDEVEYYKPPKNKGRPPENKDGPPPNQI